MDLVGPISPRTSKGSKYILTVIDMLTGYTIAVPITDKRTETVCKAYRDSVYCIFGGSSRIMTDNGTEFKSKEMKQICEDLDIKQVFSPVYTPQSNGRLEGWHRFLKACIAKHIRGADVEWDDLIPLAVSAYNFFPCQSSKESPFVLMFGRDPITPIAKLLEPKLKFYGEKGIGVNMDTLRKLYTVVAENIRKAREKQPRQETAPTKLQVNDLVLVKDPESAAFDPKYMPNYRVTAIYGRNRIEVQDEKGNKSVRRAAHVKICEPVDKVIHQLPPQAVYEQYGRRSKLLIHPKDVPEVPLQLFEQCKNNLEKIDECDESQNRTETEVTVHEISHHNTVELNMTSTQPIDIDTSDASWNRQERQHDENRSLNFVTENLIQMDGDCSDKSRCRPGVMMYSGQRSGDDSDEENGHAERTPQNVHSNDTDESNSRETGSSHTDKGMDGDYKSAHLAINLTEYFEGHQTPSTGMVCDESISRQARCSMSADKRMQQPVTPVVQSESVGSTVVNIQDVDECLVTNKHANVKHDSLSTNSKWLSSTFSMITSGILGTNQAKTGEDFTENVDANSNAKLVFKPEFNFFL